MANHDLHKYSAEGRVCDYGYCERGAATLLANQPEPGQFMALRPMCHGHAAEWLQRIGYFTVDAVIVKGELDCE